MPSDLAPTGQGGIAHYLQTLKSTSIDFTESDLVNWLGDYRHELKPGSTIKAWILNHDTNEWEYVERRVDP